MIGFTVANLFGHFNKFVFNWRIYSVVLASTVQRRDSAIGVHVAPSS